MAIKQVDFIPKKNGKPSYSQLVYSDIKLAYEQHFSQFELVGDYNFNTLSSIANYQAEQFFRETIYNPVCDRIKSRLIDEGFTEICIPDGWKNYKNYITVYGVTESDRKHVYVEIHFETIESLEERLYFASKRICKKVV